MKKFSNALGVLLAWAALHAHAQGFLETPGPDAAQSGIGVIAGWHCTASRIVVQIDELRPMLASSGSERTDTAAVCGHPNTGFSVVVNWNTLPIYCFGCAIHRVRAYADGMVFADVTFRVTHFGVEYMTGKSATYTLRNFPDVGLSVGVRWDESKQNFTIDGVTDPRFRGSLGSTEYFGALFRGPQNPMCGPFSTANAPRYGSFRVGLSFDAAGEAMSFTANYADGGSCSLPRGVREPVGSGNREGYIVGRFDAAATAHCPEFPQGLTVRIDGERLVADSQDACATGHVVGISRTVDR